MKIELEKNGIRWTVRCGDKYDCNLDGGEALFVVANLIIKPEERPMYLMTQAEHDAWDLKYGRKSVAATAEGEA